jgi:phenylacetate-CoA ligase
MQELKVDQKELEKRVKHVVSLSKEIPWYVRKYKELGIDPDEIRSPQDLLKAYEKGLYTTPEDLPELVYYEDKNTKEFYTSGTTRGPKRVGMNKDDEKRAINQNIRLFQQALKKSDRVLNCFPAPPAISGYWENCALSALGYTYVHLPAQELRSNPNKFIEYYKEFKPTALGGLTTFVYRLPLLLEGVGLCSKKLGITSIFTGGEASDISRRKEIGNEFEAKVYDLYGTSESGLVAYELKPFTDEFNITLHETLVFLIKNGEQIGVGEIGDVLLTNLYDPTLLKPYMVLLNYKIGDWAKCIEKENEYIITSIGEIRREITRTKLHPQEVEKAIEDLKEYKKKLSGEYTVIDFQTIPREPINKLIQQGVEIDEKLLEKLRRNPEIYKNWDRKAESEIRIESRYNLQSEEKEEIGRKVREIIYSSNIPLKTLVEEIGEARLFIEIKDIGDLYKGFKKLIKPGKPKRFIGV